MKKIVILLILVASLNAQAGLVDYIPDIIKNPFSRGGGIKEHADAMYAGQYQWVEFNLEMNNGSCNASVYNYGIKDYAFEVVDRTDRELIGDSNLLVIAYDDPMFHMSEFYSEYPDTIWGWHKDESLDPGYYVIKMDCVMWEDGNQNIISVWRWFANQGEGIEVGDTGDGGGLLGLPKFTTETLNAVIDVIKSTYFGGMFFKLLDVIKLFLDIIVFVANAAVPGFILFAMALEAYICVNGYFYARDGFEMVSYFINKSIRTWIEVFTLTIKTLTFVIDSTIGVLGRLGNLIPFT